MPPSPEPAPTPPRSLLDQAQEAAEIAAAAFAQGNPVVGIAGVQLAADLVRLAKILGEGHGRDRR